MLPLVLLVSLTVALSHWVVEPLTRLASTLLSLGWISSLLLAALAWLFAGGPMTDDSRR